MLRKIFFFLLLIFSLTAFVQPKVRYRWPLKLLMDKKGYNAVGTEAIATTVDALDTIARPAGINAVSKRTETEELKVTVDAYIIARGHEKDGDYHLVLQSINSNATVIAEIPNPKNPKLKENAPLRLLYGQCRHFIDSSMGAPWGGIRTLRKKRKVNITGVLFFDKMSHGTGHAPNGIEIHTVLEIKGIE